ncbi:hypothetical protein FALBO_2099 [Fusarium albosuccineum]|uniref:Uncharacterized protein n=1 Tax=Fusarium albosuccineum TaxID=1237068 RepID=A0A8H4PH45_9HYPO|nr:hypothetical protein FALBO_2099 [Fusarium albosuccineum]
MDSRLFQLEWDRSKKWLANDEEFVTSATQNCLEALQTSLNELDSELPIQSRSPIARGIESAFKGSRSTKEKLRDLQQVNNAIDSLKILEISKQTTDSKSKLKSLEDKVTTLDRNIQSFRAHNEQFEAIVLERLNDSLEILRNENSLSQVSSSDAESQSSFESARPDNDSHYLERLHALSILGLEALAKILKCEEYSEFSNRLRVWGLGVLEGPFRLNELYLHATDTNMDLDALLHPLSNEFETFIVPFAKILEHILTRIEASQPEAIAFLQSSEQLLHVQLLQNGRGDFLVGSDIIYIPDADRIVDVPEQIYSCTENIHDSIEGIFDLLPGVGSLRQASSLVRADRRRTGGASTGQGVRLAANSVHIAHELTTLLRRRGPEENRTKETDLTELLASDFEEEAERLAEWTKSQNATTGEMNIELSHIRSVLFSGS